MEKIQLNLGDGKVIFMEIEQPEGERRVGSTLAKEVEIDEVASTLSLFSEKLFESMLQKEAINLNEISLELNIGLTIESGGITRLIIKGQGSFAFKVKLAWKRYLDK